MKCLRMSFEVDATKYEENKGLEDGFELLSDVVTHGMLVCTDNLIKIKRPNGSIVCPYISTRRGRSFIEEGDYIITEPGNIKHTCSEASFIDRFKILD